MSNFTSPTTNWWGGGGGGSIRIKEIPFDENSISQRNCLRLGLAEAGSA